MTKMDRRKFINTSTWLLGGLAVSPFLGACQPQQLSFGWVTDIHYAEAKVKWDRYFFESKEKLSEAILLYNQLGLDFIIETGDFKDENAAPDKERTKGYLQEIEQVFQYFNGPCYHVLGNHDVDTLSKSEFQALITNYNIPGNQTHYSYVHKGWRFIVLDACFRSDGQPYDTNNFEWFDTAIPREQIMWLENELSAAHEPVCIFVHQPLDGEGNLFVNNAVEVRRVLEKSNKVLAVFQGHRHEGDYKQMNGIHYITQKAMVDYSGMMNSSYSVVDLLPEGRIQIKGYRRAESRVLESAEEVMV